MWALSGFFASQILNDSSVSGPSVKDALETLASGAGPCSTIDGVSNPGGDIDLVAGINVIITPDNVLKKITFDVVEIAIFNAQTGITYQLVLGDAGKIVTLTNAAPIAVTIPTNGVVPFIVGTRIDLIQGGAGKVTFSGAGVTIKSKASNKSIGAQNVGVTLIKEATDTWYLIGDLIA